MAKRKNKDAESAKQPANTSTVVVETIKPKATPIREFFRHGRISIPLDMKIDRKRFDIMFKGKIEVDINWLWESYQSKLKG
jgi:hypothetical protein